MGLGSLRIIHLPKASLAHDDVATSVRELFPRAFCLDSCQRWLWICSEGEFLNAKAALPAAPGLQFLSGVSGYRFLLRVATGLESQIVGETDILGQLKEVWRRTAATPELNTLMHRLLEDTKEIRSRYLQNLGGASYGSLVRMMLRGRRGPTLIVGAGQIAQSVAPFLMDEELWLVNRGAENLTALHDDLLARRVEQGSSGPAIQMIGKDGEAQAWRQAANVVVCIPFDGGQDAARVGLRERAAGPVIHLGGVREAAGVWNRLASFQALDDLYALQKTQGDVRMTQIRHAAAACDEKAKLRSLGASVTIPHGWEDLAVFA